MRIKRKQLKLLIIVFGLAYLYFFYTINVQVAIPGIFQNREKISAASKELEQLEKEYLNNDQQKSQLESLRSANNRYSDYILENISEVDVINHQARFERLFFDKISQAKVSAPNPVSNYYEMSISIEAKLLYDELLEMVNYVEGGTRLSKITELTIISIDPSGGENAPSLYSEEVSLSVSMKMSYYAMNQGDVETIYEISKNRFEKFGYYDGIAMVTPDYSQVINPPNPNPKPDAQIIPVSLPDRRDLSILLTSYLSGPNNFKIMENLTKLDKGFSARIRDRQKVTLRLDNYRYSIERENPLGKNNELSGDFPGRDIGVIIRDIVSDVDVNKNIGMDIQIINESDFYVGINFDRDIDRVKVWDRNYQRVMKKSLGDKIIFV